MSQLKVIMLAPLVCLAMLVLSVSAKEADGVCKEYPAQTNFSLSSFSGKWYFKYSFDEEIVGCYTKDYLLKSETGNESVTNFTVHSEGFSLKWKETFSYDDDAALKNPRARKGEFTVIYFTGPWMLKRNKHKDYTVMLTDYNTFAILYTCDYRSYWRNQDRHFYILTRNPHATSDDLKPVRANLAKYQFSMSDFYELKTSNCAA